MASEIGNDDIKIIRFYSSIYNETWARTQINYFSNKKKNVSTIEKHGGISHPYPICFVQ